MKTYIDKNNGETIYVVSTLEDIHSLKWKLKLEFKCIKCGKVARFSFARKHEERYKTFLCTECLTTSTFQTKYGTNWYMGTPDFIKKSKQTNLNNLGCEYASQSKPFREKYTNTIKQKEKENPNVWKEMYNKLCETYKEKTGYEQPGDNPEVVNKRKKSCRDHIGHDTPLDSSNRENIKHIWMNNFGVDNPMKNKSIHDSAVQTHFEHTGYKYPIQNPITKEKTANTNIELYGSSCYLASDKHRDYMINTYGSTHASSQKIWFNGEQFDSLWEVAIYWYCIYNGIPIIRDPYKSQNGIPYIVITSDGEEKEYHYFPDFLINGELIEIKGNQLIPDENGICAIDKNSDPNDTNLELLRLKNIKKFELMNKLNIIILTSIEIKMYVDWFNSWLKMWNFNKSYYSIGKRMMYKVPNVLGINPYDMINNEKYVFVPEITGATPFDGLLNKKSYQISL